MIDKYTEIKDCTYKGERYSVRDNGAVLRHFREGKRTRINDGMWTFGIKSAQNGYMYFGHVGGPRIHIIVATAFYGARDSKVYVVDHIDTNRCNNRVENLRWLTRLENALNNEITRNKIIYLCGSIEAFINNPNILRERSNGDPSLDWMRTVTQEEAKIAYENIKTYWAEQATNPMPLVGGKMNMRVYQSTFKSDAIPNAQENSNEQAENHSEYTISRAEWDEMVAPMTKSRWSSEIMLEQENPNEQLETLAREQYGILGKRIIMSLTPRAAQIDEFFDNKRYEYPSTPQETHNAPLQAYAEALYEGAPFWRGHNGKREYAVVKWGFSKNRDALIVITKSTYIWRTDSNGDSIETPIANLAIEDYDVSEINYSLNKVEYRNDVYIHSRPIDGFAPLEYIEEVFNEMTLK